MRLTDIGPWMMLQLIKIQEGVGEGNVLFHSFMHNTEADYRPYWQPRKRSCGSRLRGRTSWPRISSISRNGERPTGRRAQQA